MKIKIVLLCSLFAIFSLPTFAADAQAKAAQKDGEIIDVLMTLNSGEISAAREALKKTDNKLDVEFAKMMEKDHTKNLADTVKIAHEINVNPVPSDTSKSLEEKNAKTLESLSTLDKEKFDKQYMDDMVTGHKDALETINSLLAEVSNPKLKALLEATHDHVNHHLKKAIEIQQQLAKK